MSVLTQKVVAFVSMRSSVVKSKTEETRSAKEEAFFCLLVLLLLPVLTVACWKETSRIVRYFTNYPKLSNQSDLRQVV